jgi:ABC-2 type transport system permease protein
MTAGNNVFKLETGSGWTRGLPNLLSAELGRWFGTRRWWTQILIWAACVNLAVAGTAFSENSPPAPELAMVFSILMGIAAPIGVAIIMQGALVGEKRSGTAAWVLSKPASRSSFLVAKLAASVLGITLTIVLAQGTIAYLIIWASSGTALPPLQFLGALGVEMLNLFFYIALGLMLGALFAHPAPVVAIPLAFLFSQQFVLGLVPELIKVLPWFLVIPPNNSNTPSITMAVMTGSQPMTYLPVATTLAASALFVIVALWAFQQQEF